jgi:threonine dehydratase
MIPYLWFEQAAERISDHIQVTPLEYDQENDIYLKWENQQVTGSFKARGAINKILTLQPWERDLGIVTASAGNHGKGLALAGRLVDAPVTVFVSEAAASIKVEAIRILGAEIRFVPGGYGEAEQAGLEYSRNKGKTWVSAYNDGQVIAGQGTLALEILATPSLQDKLTWIVPCGGGGLLAGIAAVVKTNPASQHHNLVGVQSEASPYMFELFNHRPQESVHELPSLADGLAGPVEHNSLTIPIIRHHVDEMILVSEAEIIQAMAYAWTRFEERIEPSAAVALAAVLTGNVSERPALVVITGGNIDINQHRKHIQMTAPPG